MKTSQLNKDLNTALSIYARLMGFEMTENSHFEGSSYVTGKFGAIALQWADSRCGNRVAIVQYGESGGIHVLTSYLSPKELVAYVDGANDHANHTKLIAT